MNGTWGFLTPLGLLAGLSLAAIVLLHMRRQIPERRIVPSLRFWSETRREDRERSRLRRPPFSWLLVLQLLAALAVTLALARPVAGDLFGSLGGRTTPEHQIVILDGSTSMQAATSIDSPDTMFTEARRRVVDRLHDWRPGDITTVLIAGSRIQTYTATNQQQADDLARRIGTMAPPGGRADMTAALRLAGDLLLPDRQNSITLVTDGAVTVDPAIASAIAAPIHLATVGNGAAPANDAIVAISSRSDPSQRDRLRIAFTIAHFGDQAATIPYTVQVGGTSITSSDVTLAAGESRQIEVSVPADAPAVVVSIPQRDVLQADNSASLQLQRDDLTQLAIMLVSDNPGQLQRALAVIPGAHVEVYPGSTPGIKALAAGYDLAVFEGITPAANDMPAIPMIFFQPQPQSGAFTISGAMPAPAIDRVDAGAELLTGVDLAGVTIADTPVYGLSGTDREVVGGVSKDGTRGPLIWQGTLGDQPYIATAFVPESSNIGQRVAFPILVARAVSLLTTDQIPGAIAIGDTLTYRPTAGTARIEIKAPDGKVSTLDVPSAVGTNATTTANEATNREMTFGGTDVSGVYTLQEIAADGSTGRQGSFVVNAGHPQESNLQRNDRLESSLAEAGAENRDPAKTGSARSDLWPLLVGAALLLIGAEWLLYLHGRRPARRSAASSAKPAAAARGGSS